MPRKILSTIALVIASWFLLGVAWPEFPLPLLWGFFANSSYCLILVVALVIPAALIWRTGRTRFRRLAQAVAILFLSLALFVVLSVGFFIPWWAGHYVVLGRGQWHGELEGIGKPNCWLWHVTRNFNVTYSFDEYGWRDIQDHDNPVGEIVLLGCSYTFGWGVENEETWSYLVSQEGWRDNRVINLSSPGWGPWQISWTLDDFLRTEPILSYDRSAPPVVVIYSWLNFHLNRMSQRELNGDDAESAAVKRLLAMKSACDVQGIPFYILQLTAHGDLRVDPVIVRFVEAGGNVIDFRAECPVANYPDDGHPTRVWHRKLASLVQQHPKLNELVRRARPSPAE